MPVGGWSSGAGAVRLLRSRPVCPRVRSMAGSRTTVLGQGLWRWLALVAVLVGGTLSGCTDGAAQPKPLPSPSSSPSPTASTSSAAAGVSAPTLPAIARGTSAASAEAFVRHYIRLVNYVTWTGRAEVLRESSRASCRSCAAISEASERVYRNGGHIRSAGWRIRRIDIVAGSTPQRKAANLSVFQSPERVTASRGARPKSYTGGLQDMAIHLRLDKRRWSVARLDLVQ